MESANPSHVALGVFVIAAAFGAIARRARFCAVGAISDWLHIGDTARPRSWFLAIGVAIAGLGALKLLTPIDVATSVYLSARFDWLGYMAGGLSFGVGMTLASGCAQRNLVLAGGGNLKSVVVLLALGAAAYMTLHGLLAPLRIGAFEATAIDLAAAGAAVAQAVPTLLARAIGVENGAGLETAAALLAGAAIIGLVFRGRRFHRRLEQVFAGASLGLVVVAAWYLAGIAGSIGAGPSSAPSYNLNFVIPFAEIPEHVMRRPGAGAGFGLAALFGVAFGSFVHALATGGFRLERFASRGDLLAHLAGGALMGFGGVLAGGGTIGQGISGVSTLGLGSLMALASIVLGAILAMRVQYHLLDDIGLPRALARALAELRPRPARRDPDAV